PVTPTPGRSHGARVTTDAAAATPLTVYLAGLVAAFGARSWMHRRRTGSTRVPRPERRARICRVVGRDPLRRRPRARRRGPCPGPHRHYGPHSLAPGRAVGGSGSGHRRLRRRAGCPGGWAPPGGSVSTPPSAPGW